MSEDRETEGTGFKVRDRRTFSPDEAAAAGAPVAAPEDAQAGTPSGPSDQQQAAAEQAADAAAQRTRAGEVLPEIDFGTFLISLSTSALYHLGAIPDPDTNQAETNLPLAKQTIDIIGMLGAKTEGNRTADESRLLEGLLYDLRLRYVNAVRK